MKSIVPLTLVFVTSGSLFAQFDGSGGAWAPPPVLIEHAHYPNLDLWMIHEPNVRHSITHYTQIVFTPGDTITISAGGGVQTGGLGKTWKLYVDPRGPNSDRLYHGLIHIPEGPNPVFPTSPTVKAMNNMVRILEVLKKGQALRYELTNVHRFESNPEPNHLVLGYEDDDYSDNGYKGHDNGTDNQTKGVGPAWVRIAIAHHSPVPIGSVSPARARPSRLMPSSQPPKP